MAIGNMKAIFLTVIISVFLSLYTHEIQAQSVQAQTSVISFGTRDIIRSKILNEQRSILVFVPTSASSQIYSKQLYPLDGRLNHRYPLMLILTKLQTKAR